MSNNQLLAELNITQQTLQDALLQYNAASNNIRRTTIDLGSGTNQVMFDPLVQNNGYNTPYQHPTLEDVRLADIRSSIAQKNTMYVIGTITSATLIILAIMVANK